jgi:hypothetical protein
MIELKKSVIFDIEQRYFLINKIIVKFGKPLYHWDFFTLFYFNQQNLITI